uniref:Putative Cytochrome P450 71D11 n=1 Tax=Aegilops tauschii TaxID=37682 RepID=M8CIH9_AEGTA
MEWLSFSFVALSTLLAIWLLQFSGGKDKPAKKKLPPGPWTLPIIGSLHHVVSILPHRTMMQLSRRHGPLMLLRLGEVPVVVVSGAEVATLVMKTNDLTFASRPRSVTLDIFGCGGKDIAFAPYGNHWRQMRKICVMELLSSAQVKRMESVRAEEKVMALSNDVVTRAVFGGKFAQQGEYIRELQEVFRLLGGFCLVDLFPSSRLVRWLSSGERHMKTSYGCIQRIIADVIEERKGTRASDAGSSTAGEEDMLEVLLRLQQEDSLKFPLTTETMAAVLFDIFAGGTETTANILSWAMSELMHSPNTMAKAQQEVREALGKDRAIITNSDHVELHYVWMVIMEVLRLHPPGPLVPRMAREECTVMGYDIPKGTSVYINVFAISRDPRYWNNPEEFRPERFENNHLNYKGTHFEFIPFGTGRRQCPGIQFSSSLIEMALTNLLYHFDWMLPSGIDLASFDMSEKFGLAVSKRLGLLHI